MLSRFILLIVALTPFAAIAQFEGELVLEPPGCESVGLCTIKDKLRFRDTKGVDWEAAAGLKTDGASIPPVFQPIVGKPFERSFIKAAIIHDHYCERHVRSWRQTHRVFYEGLIAEGVPTAKAKVMYYGVYLGGPKWVELIPGNQCQGNCINQLRNLATYPGGPAIQSRPSQYDKPWLVEELRQISMEIEADPDRLSIEQLEARAQARRPDDFYFRNGDQVVTESGLPTE